MAAKGAKDKRTLKGAGGSFTVGNADPFPGIPLKYVVTEDMDPDDIRALTDRAGPNGTIRKVLKGGSTVTFKPDRDLKIDKSDSALLKKPSNEKGKSGKTKEEIEEERHRYDFLGEEDLTPAKNPKRFELLFPYTRNFVENAGISGADAEKDEIKWTTLMNSLRFLKVDEGLKFTSSPSKWRTFSEEEEHELIPDSAPPKNFKVQKVLGEGAYGAVYTCKCPTISDKPLAVKKLPHTVKKEKNFNFNEIHFLKKLPHPSIVKYHNSYVVRDEIWIVTELMEGGPLSQAKADYDESNIAFAAREILKGLVHLHSNNVVHRDLKSENIMFSVNGEVKLIDFGLAASVAEGPLIQMCGSPFWLSPEMVRMEPHSFPTDVWSFAISLLEMINGHPPHRDNVLGLMYSVGTLKENDPAPVAIDDDKKWSPELREFLKLALIPSQDMRFAASALLEHPFLQKACKQLAMSEVLRRVFVITALEDSFF